MLIASVCFTWAMPPLLLLDFSASFSIYTHTHAHMPHLSWCRTHLSVWSQAAGASVPVAWALRGRPRQPAPASTPPPASRSRSATDMWVVPHLCSYFLVVGSTSHPRCSATWMGIYWWVGWKLHARTGRDKKWHLWADPVQPGRDRHRRALQWCGQSHGDS